MGIPPELIHDLFRYRESGEGCTGELYALRYYRKGVALTQRSDDHTHADYEHFFDHRKHSVECNKREKELFLEAIDCFRTSAKAGNELAMMNYGLFLYHFGIPYDPPSPKDKGYTKKLFKLSLESKKRITTVEPRKKALDWFCKASELGLATADLAISVCLRDPTFTDTVDEEKADFHLSRFRERINADHRQSVLAYGLDGEHPDLSISRLFLWCCGEGDYSLYDVPGFFPRPWLYIRG